MTDLTALTPSMCTVAHSNVVDLIEPFGPGMYEDDGVVTFASYVPVHNTLADPYSFPPPE
jgi:hypothetical protein